MLPQGCSTCNYGWDEILTKHPINSWAPIQETIGYRYRWYNGTHYDCGVTVYDLSLYQTDGLWVTADVVATANLSAVMEGGYSLRIVTAYCNRYSGACLAFVGSGGIGFAGSGS